VPSGLLVTPVGVRARHGRTRQSVQVSSTEVIVIVLVVLLLAAVAGGLAAIARKRGRETDARRQRAAELRRQAEEHAPRVEQSKAKLVQAEAGAAQARHRADRAEEYAAEVRLGAAVDEAHLEDVVREADSIDPSVKHRAGDYRPVTPSDDSASAGGSHRA
jgi:Sec-independent protein translocase protein TatA